MKTMTAFLILIVICSCSNSPSVSTPGGDSSTQSTTNCAFTVDTFSFKGITIGMNVAEFTDTILRRGYMYYEWDNPRIGSGGSLEAPWMNSSIVHLTNSSDYSIFKNDVYSIDLGVFDGKVFAIHVRCKANGSDIVGEMLHKFNLDSTCVSNSDGQRSAVFSNDNLSVSCAYWEASTYPYKLDAGGALFVYDVRVMKQVEDEMVHQGKEIRKAQEDSATKDF